jgi:hypothetical protein
VVASQFVKRKSCNNHFVMVSKFDNRAFAYSTNPNVAKFAWCAVWASLRDAAHD